MRWIDLSAHAMSLKIAILPTTRALVLEGGDANPAAATGLGFKRRPSGAWVREGADDVNPREFLRVLPQAVVREMDESEYVVRIGRPAAVPAAHAFPVAQAPAVEVLVGMNRMGQLVYETDGSRHAVDGRGRQTTERGLATAAPGFFLRAVDDVSLRECAEGYVEQCARQPDAVATLDAFAVTVGEPSTERLARAVATAAARAVGKGQGTPLGERFGRASSIQAALSRTMPDLLPLTLRVAVRRLMGTDAELVGSALSSYGSRGASIADLAPRGTRRAPSVAEADIQVDAPPAGDGTVDLPGIGSVRRDAAETLARVLERPDGSRSLILLASPSTLGPAGAQGFVEALASTHSVEAAALVAGPQPALVVSVGGALPPGVDGRPVEIASVADDAALWTWASGAAVSRSSALEAALSGTGAIELGLADASLSRTSFQTPYTPASRVGDASTMVPRELEGPTREALAKVVSLYGDVDERVRIEFGIPEDSLSDVLASEQVDALALYLHAEDRGRAMMIGDGTGVGKGRPLACIQRRAVVAGKRVLVLSERDDNLADLLRDVHHVGAEREVVPAVLNDAQLIDERSGAAFATGDRSALLKAVGEGRWPEGVQVVYATYSQFNRPPEESERAAWLREVVDEDTLVVMDEVQNAASMDSNTSANMTAAIERAGSVVLASATYAANPRMVSFFKPLFPDGISADEIAAMMRRGGEQFQEVVSAMLVSDGVMVRRELDLSAIEFVQLVDSERQDRNREMMDRLAEVMGEMAALSGDLDRWVADENARPRREGVRSLRMSSSGFGSPLHVMTRLFVSSLLADHAAERAVAALEAGEKPMVLVDNTIAAILDGVSDTGEAPDFKHVVHRVIDQIATVRREREDGTTERVAADVPGLPAAVARVRAMVDALPNLPASAIDLVKSRIEAAGFTCGEITGRSHEYRDGKVVPRTDRSRARTKNAFNSGGIDALVFNSAGATGVDLHAGRRFADRRRRVLIELQGPAHVQKQIQAYGRSSRRDQESAPRIEFLSTGLPIEARLSAMRNVKLRRLSANVTSNRDSAWLTGGVPDLLNPVGDEVVSRYAKMRPDLMRRLCLWREEEQAVHDEAAEAGAEADDGRPEREYSANELLSRLMLLPTRHQEKVFSELVGEYRAHIEELEARGENPLRPREMDGIVHVHGSRVFEGGMSSGSDSAFDGPLHLLDVTIERVVEPIRADAVLDAVERGVATQSEVARAALVLAEGLEALIEPFLPKRARSVEDAIASGDRMILSLVRDAALIREAVAELVPGREIRISSFGTENDAIVVDVQAPKPGFEHLAHLYSVGLAVPGDTSVRRLRLSTLLNDPAFAPRGKDGSVDCFLVSEGLEGEGYDDVLDRFENATATTRTHGRILGSNIFRAVRLATEHKLGKLVSYVDENGIRSRGVLVRPDFHRKLDMLELRLDGARAATAALVEMRAELDSAPHTPGRGVLVSAIGDGSWSVRLPARPARSKSALWQSETFLALHATGVADEKGRSRLRVDGPSELGDLLRVLEDVGIGSWYASAKHRRDAEARNAASVEPERWVA